MNHKNTSIAAAAFATLALALACADAQAQMQAASPDNVIKIGVTRYNSHSSTDGIHGIGVPAGADAKVGDATTVIFVYERMVTPNVGVEFVLGVPPTIKAKATGSVAFLGDDVLSARNVAPTLLFNYHFFTADDAFRPYLGAGINYTKFTNAKSKLASDVKLGDSYGLALQAGVNYAITKDWGLFASVAHLDVKSKLVASGSTVLTTTIDFNPWVYSIGGYWQF
jgi:outer membrane protein